MRLLSPIDVGPLTLANRMVSTSHQTGLVDGHLPTPDLVAYHEARARGGVGAIFVEATAVHPTGLLTTHTLGGYLPAIVDGYRALVEAVEPHGTRLLVQLFHGGREQFASPPRAPAVSASATPSARLKTEPRALTAREIDELIAGYAASAALAREGGVHGIELSMAHGYLLAQFFTPQLNRRQDRYAAGPQLAHEVILAVREAAGPELALGVRLAADELGPGLADAGACAEMARAVCHEMPLDFVSFALGHSATYAASAYIAPPPPAPANAIGHSLARARAAVAPLPVIAATRVVDPQAAERLLADDAADLVGMTRALIADPDLPAKVAAGREDERIECVGCNQSCIGHYHAGVPIGCAVNPRTGRERTWHAAAHRPGADLLVIGAGPAGIAAALEAAQAGARVTLVERDDDIGGQLRLAGRAPAHAELWERYERMARRALTRAGVDIHLGRAADGAEHARRIVLATGAQPYRPALAGDYLTAWEAIAAPEHAGDSVLVADWGGEWGGLDAAEALAGSGRAVTLACAALHPGETLHQYQRYLYLARLDELGVQILHHHELDDQAVLRNVFSGRARPLPPHDTLVVAHGRTPDDALWPALEERATRAGDVLGPRTLEEAVLEGALAARQALDG